MQSNGEYIFGFTNQMGEYILVSQNKTIYIYMPLKVAKQHCSMSPSVLSEVIRAGTRDAQNMTYGGP